MIYRKSIFVLLSSVCAWCFPVHAQEDLKVFVHPDQFYKKYFPDLKVKRIPLDTVYIKRYPNYLSVSVKVLSPAFYSSISTKNSITPGVDADAKFRTSVGNIIGFSASYRFVSAGFALLLNQGLQKHHDYAPSSYRTATVKYNNSIYSLQFKYLKLKGFTDINAPPNLPVRKRPDIVNKEYQFEGVYNFGWRRYSYLAPLEFSQRQLKSRAGILLKGGFYYKYFSGDSALITKEHQAYYQELADSKGIRTFSIKLAPGVGGNLVLYKHIYLAAAAFASADVYFYKYLKNNDEVSAKRSSLVFALDGYASLGFQSKRLYAGLRFETDTRNAALYGIKMSILNTYTGLEVGYRFDAPKPLKKFYKKTMPPGM